MKNLVEGKIKYALKKKVNVLIVKGYKIKCEVYKWVDKKM